MRVRNEQTSPARLELRELDAQLHELIVQLWREQSVEGFKKLKRVKNYALRAFVALHPSAGTRRTA